MCIRAFGTAIVRLAAIVLAIVMSRAAIAQITYISQNRSVSVGSFGVENAPDFAPFQTSLTRGGGFGQWGTASQDSALGPASASIIGRAETTNSESYNPTSQCAFVFRVATAMEVRIVDRGAAAMTRSISLSGPGVAYSQSSGLWNFTGTLQAGQDYSFSAQCSGNSSFDVLLSVEPLQASAFTFQGKLNQLDSPVSGPTDLQFRLFSQESGGTQAGPTLLANDVQVEAGLFSTMLDFGQVLTGEPRWLEISVRNPAGSGSFTTLSPRTRLHSSPYAAWANRAFAATTAGSADFAIRAESSQNAVNATTAASATTATTASSVPWSGVTGVLSNVSGAFSPWSPVSNGFRIGTNLGVSIGTPENNAALEVNSGQSNAFRVSVEGEPWAIRIFNSAASTYETGMYITNTGFFRITNRIANPSGFAQLSSTGAWTTASDARLKTDVTNASGNLAAALKLRPVNFRWNADGMADFGLIAQEVRQVLPRLVTGDESKESLTVNYSQLSVVAIGAIQELKLENDAIRRENAELKARLAAIEAALPKMSK